MCEINLWESKLMRASRDRALAECAARLNLCAAACARPFHSFTTSSRSACGCSRALLLSVCKSWKHTPTTMVFIVLSQEEKLK